MELKEFLEKFLPDYEAKLKDALIAEKKVCDLCNLPFTDAEKKAALMKLLKQVFPEALQNFVDKICKEQRISCSHSYLIVEQRYNDREFTEKCILESKQPDID
ncbi:hypothetical protein AGMMS49525_04970 [Bacteroidia bacterium]|nr:hypothetical protein AGMMS49525_04970 [Bacteroidia bacterium]